MLEIKLARRAPINNMFYCITKGDIKIVYYLHQETETVFSIASKPEIQSQLLEALIEYFIFQFFDTFDKSLLQTCYGDTCDIFSYFNKIVIDTFNV